MRLAKVTNGHVENIIIAEPATKIKGYMDLDDDSIGIGDLYVDGIFVKAPQDPNQIALSRRVEIELRRDAKLAEGVPWNGRRWQIDDVMRSALQWRITRWQLGRLATDATLPVRAMDNTIQMLGRDDHLALAEAIEAYGAQIYAESWAEKDAI